MLATKKCFRCVIFVTFELQLAAALQTAPAIFAFFFGFSPNSSGIVLEEPSLVDLETLKKASFKEVEACINLEEG